ncbi:hypothetical protein N7499_011570 [Penicillium canescens]|uniref:Complex III subunit 9 n=1 Tax=Penicillium canescens TaxID=5083 RepID=A0AAD6IKD4_PENCN|nr:uncharacterized protein N7446_006829 [Penicillium canescens]KAJ5991026.1 hypothetical protein N7522_011233 [Penicillium canescens]KAJ6049843.1 hypothetical protein N7444_006559 [Penicillium canescens]KAJ6052187.1 hypothetical protein N7460_002721 [Penicillium canescens]KAJ6062709.1 hypothetical protein N7446_006829 [Penicillium canescens]KAJ6069683.1 hypothetical protein N7499_011570 [Penicillium canescens]
MAGLANAIYSHVSPPSFLRSQLQLPDQNLTADCFALFRTFIRKNTVLLTTAFAGAFAFELGFDITSNKIWDSWNQGRQWKDIKHRYMVKEEEDDE